MERKTAHLDLSIEVGSDPITGSVSVPSYSAQPFSGWVELVAAIEAARNPGAGTGDSGEAGTQTPGSIPGAKGPEL